MSLTYVRESSWIRTVAIVVLATLALFAASTQRTSAVPSGISFAGATPTDGNTLFVSRTASNNPLNPPTFQLKADVWLSNGSAVDREVTSVTFKYPGSSIPDRTYTPLRFGDLDNDEATPDTSDEFQFPANMAARVAIHDGLDRDLPTPLPATVQIDIYLDNDPEPLTLTYDLEFSENDGPRGAYFFPAMAADLAPGEYWEFGTRHTVDSGGGLNGNVNPSTRTQRYALDMGVVKWNGSAWSALYDGTYDENEDFRIWDKPLYSVADGVIVGCYRGEPDEPPTDFKNVQFEFGFGNSLFIRYGDELVSYGHMQHNTIPEELCPTADAGDPGLYPSKDRRMDLNIPVTAGQYLGRVGNTGRTTGPHLHIQVEGLASSTLEGLPMQFLNVRTLGDETTIQNLGGSPALQPMHGMTLHKHALILPNPCGIDLPDEGLLEVSRHGISAECYQDVFNMIVSRGYRPTFVDGYDVGGQTFFNATFRPAGPAWVSRHGLTGEEYQDLFDDLTGKGYRLHQIDSYLQNGQVRYAAIFEVRSGPNFAAFHGYTDAEYDQLLADLTPQGFVPVNISTVEVGGEFYWTGLFEQVWAGWTVATVPAANYQATFDDNIDAGRRPIYVHGFDTSWGPYITGIWVDPMGGAWQAVHGFVSDDYQDAFDANMAAGRFTRYTSGYDAGNGTHLFAATWRGRPNTSISQKPAAITNQTSATFGFAADNPFTTFECKLDAGNWAACSSTKSYNGLSEGYHTFSVRAVDRERIIDLSPASYTWLVDVTAPSITIALPAVNTKTVNGELVDEPVEMTTVIGWADVVADVTDNLSGVASVQFKVNGVVVASQVVDSDTWSFEFEPHLKGENVYTIEVVATDKASNTSTASIQVLGTATGKKH